MNRRILLCILQLLLLTSTGFLDIASAEAKKVIINVPYRVKNIKHTHTIYKIIPHYHKSKSHGHHSDESEHYNEYYR